ncbi:RloB family protein [Frisingicoccus sp.]|uniref:RloB family protein n=1 Tax=Frisingicoccus sp. TaxID=1918627 RepID=UPI002EC7F1DF|nr:RloB family protein [Frisingicoccus sp.]
MRESRTFAERTKVLKSDEALKKYFLVYEGSDTEVIYFDAVNSMRESIGINPLIELIPIIRSYSEEGWSNPKKILDRIIENLEESKAEKISYETLLNRMMDYFYETKVITTSKVLAKSMWRAMVYVCTEELQKVLQEEVDDIETDCNRILEFLKQEYDVTHVVSDISDIIKDGGLTYAEGFDQICLIIDRDRESFLATPENNQYEYVVEKCREKGFQLCITNPCFEFWLLLHFDEVFELDTEKLLKNPKVTSKRRYAEQEFRRIYPKYKKSSYQAEELVRDIDKAIQNEKEFCEDINGLENTVGSNIGRLIEKMRIS